MGPNVFFSFFFSFVINHYASLCFGHWITNLKFVMSSNISDDVVEKSNSTDFLEEMIENNSGSAAEKDDTFWPIPDGNGNTTEANAEFQNDTAYIEFGDSNDKLDFYEENKNDTTSSNTNSSVNVEMDLMNSSQVVSFSDADEVNLPTYDEILLQRNNCRLEISISAIHDLKVAIRFGKMENNTSGQCCITLNGCKNNMLGILISNIHLYENAFQGELLKVIIPNFGMDFVLKKYYPQDNYEPLLLTETHKVYVVLYYNVTHVPYAEEDTHFNLEVFGYGKNENYIHYD